MDCRDVVGVGGIGGQIFRRRDPLPRPYPAAALSRRDRKQSTPRVQVDGGAAGRDQIGDVRDQVAQEIPVALEKRQDVPPDRQGPSIVQRQPVCHIGASGEHTHAA